MSYDAFYRLTDKVVISKVPAYSSANIILGTGLNLQVPLEEASRIVKAALEQVDTVRAATYKVVATIAQILIWDVWFGAFWHYVISKLIEKGTELLKKIKSLTDRDTVLKIINCFQRHATQIAAVEAGIIEEVSKLIAYKLGFFRTYLFVFNTVEFTGYVKKLYSYRMQLAEKILESLSKEQDISTDLAKKALQKIFEDATGLAKLFLRVQEETLIKYLKNLKKADNKKAALRRIKYITLGEVLIARGLTVIMHLLAARYHTKGQHNQAVILHALWNLTAALASVFGCVRKR